MRKLIIKEDGKEYVKMPIFKYGELSTQAQETARGYYQHSQDYDWHGEAIESINAFFKHFETDITDFSIDWLNPSRSFIKFNAPTIGLEAIRARLATIDTGKCELTGVCFDEDLLDGFKSALSEGNELKGCMYSAFESFLTACSRDFEYQISEEAFLEDCEANEWVFLEDGRLV